MQSENSGQFSNTLRRVRFQTKRTEEEIFETEVHLHQIALVSTAR
ncbi:hypothetical protein RESH_05487 [Rhodopirellula europaea SH398]|uniref:Uncharacterized protein n=1 Tax=Rhodopirellula europaea SH398 TaxID=1263868 RepID=M5RXN2_9BACT|nr:hypothetical protein RESH_05487 [Rhodopirellula europaea SH398]